MAVAQFVSLQQEVNRGWLTRELRESWARRPRKSIAVEATLSATLGGATVEAHGYVTTSPSGTPEEQLQHIWQKLSATEATLSQLRHDIKRQKDNLARQLDALRGEAQSFSVAAEQRVHKTITAAPLQTAVGFWLILLGLSMQVLHAWCAAPSILPVVVARVCRAA